MLCFLEVIFIFGRYRYTHKFPLRMHDIQDTVNNKINFPIDTDASERLK